MVKGLERMVPVATDFRSKRLGGFDLLERITLGIIAHRGKTRSVQTNARGQIIGRLPRIASLLNRNLIRNRRIFVEFTPQGIEACSLLGIVTPYTITPSPLAVPAITEAASIDPNYPMDDTGRIYADYWKNMV